jgi:hypothetical protein
VANNPLTITDPTGMTLDWSALRGKENKENRKQFKEAFRELKDSGKTGRTIVKFLKSKESGRIQLTANAEGIRPGSFDANLNLDGKGAGGLPGFDKDEIGGILNMNFELTNLITENPVDVLVEEAAHAALNSAECVENGSNSKGLASGNNEFTAKAIVGQIEKEIGRNIPDFGKDRTARMYGRQAFSSGSTNDFFQNIFQWRSQQISSYKNSRIDERIPVLLKKLINK